MLRFRVVLHFFERYIAVERSKMSGNVRGVRQPITLIGTHYGPTLKYLRKNSEYKLNGA